MDNATPAPLPLWDLKSALFPSVKTGRTLRSLNWRSTRDDASCCQPLLSASNSKSSRGGGGRAPRARADHEGGSKPPTPSNSLAAATATDRYGVSPPASSDQHFCDVSQDASGEPCGSNRSTLPNTLANWSSPLLSPIPPNTRGIVWRSSQLVRTDLLECPKSGSGISTTLRHDTTRNR